MLVGSVVEYCCLLNSGLLGLAVFGMLAADFAGELAGLTSCLFQIYKPAAMAKTPTTQPAKRLFFTMLVYCFYKIEVE